MKIHYSFLVVFPLFAAMSAILLPYFMIETRSMKVFAQWWWAPVTMSLCVVLLTVVIGRIWPWAIVRKRSIDVKGREGAYHVRHRLNGGDKFVIYRNGVYVRRRRGEMEKTWLRRWTVAKRDWRKLEERFPRIPDERRREPSRSRS
ncbi:hypothetical protein [Salininema proteolyticum]|uniref:Uncharacterized protein n=1 Tax=Salininema proteolyticum TaxID=1607685 RepID=A0ABV8TUS7_9ACTN